MISPPELQRLLPQARAVLRFLDDQPQQGAPISAIRAGTGLSARALGRAIRRLVTRYYLDMPAPGYYTLTAAGRQAVRDLRLSDDEPIAPPADATPLRSTPPSAALEQTVPLTLARLGDNTPLAAERRHTRRMTVVMPQALVVHRTAALKVGFDAADEGQPPLRLPGRVVLRLTAAECMVEPGDRPVEVTGAAAGPVRFRVTPQRAGTYHLTFEVFQLVAPDDLRRVGGMYCDVDAVEVSTPTSADFKTWGATVTLFAG